MPNLLRAGTSSSEPTSGKGVMGHRDGGLEVGPLVKKLLAADEVPVETA